MACKKWTPVFFSLPSENRQPQFIFHNYHFKANPPRPHSTLAHQRQLLSTSHQLTTVGLLVCLVMWLKTAVSHPVKVPSHLPTLMGLHTHTYIHPLTAQRRERTGSRQPNRLICNCEWEKAELLYVLLFDRVSALSRTMMLQPQIFPSLLLPLPLFQMFSFFSLLWRIVRKEGDGRDAFGTFCCSKLLALSYSFSFYPAPLLHPCLPFHSTFTWIP